MSIVTIFQKFVRWKSERVRSESIRKCQLQTWWIVLLLHEIKLQQGKSAVCNSADTYYYLKYYLEPTVLF
jgi:hypothetical protein